MAKRHIGVGNRLLCLPFLAPQATNRYANGKARCCYCLPVPKNDPTKCKHLLSIITALVLALLALYVTLVLISIFVSPFPACASLAANFVDEPCQCSCFVKDSPTGQPYYHPGAPTHLHFHDLMQRSPAVAHDTMRPWLNGTSHLCGQCPITDDGHAWPHCAEQAKQQRTTYKWPYTQKFVHDVGNNRTNLLACYQPECLALTTHYFKNHLSYGPSAFKISPFGPKPKDHLCNILQSDTNNVCQTKFFKSAKECQ